MEEIIISCDALSPSSFHRWLGDRHATTLYKQPWFSYCGGLAEVASEVYYNIFCHYPVDVSVVLPFMQSSDAAKSPSAFSVSLSGYAQSVS